MVRDLTAIGADDMTDPRFPDRVQRWIGNLMAKRTWAKKAHPASGAYKRKLLVIARAFVHYAQKRRLIAYDPLAPLSIGRINTHRRPVFTIEELRKLVSDDASVIDRADRGTSAKTLSITHGNQEVAARYLGISPSTMSYRLSTPPKPDPWWPFACLVAYTGVRAGEARSITWSMVDWEAGVIRLPAEAQGNKMQRDRRIRIQPELKDILRGLSLKAAEIDTPIIGHEISGYDQHDIYDGFIRYCRRHGVLGKPRGPHTLRHSFCGLMTALGASPFLVMDAAGHSTTQISKHYCEAAEEYIDQIANWPRHHYWPEFQLRQSPPLVASLHQGNETVNHHPFHRFIG